MTERERDIRDLTPQQRVLIVLGIIEVAETYHNKIKDELVCGRVIASYLYDAKEALLMELRHARP